MPQRTRISTEEKVRIVRGYTEGEIGICEASRRLGLSEATVRQWVSRYRAEGTSGLQRGEEQELFRRIETGGCARVPGGVGHSRHLREIQDQVQTAVRNWVKVYRHERFRVQTGGSRMTKGRLTTPEERLEIVHAWHGRWERLRRDGTKVSGIVSASIHMGSEVPQHGTGRSGGSSKHRVGTLPGRTPEEELRGRVAQLEREKNFLEMENALLKKVKELERRRR